MKRSSRASALTQFEWIPLGSILRDAGLITDEQLTDVLDEQRGNGRRLGETIVELGFASERQISAAIAEQYGLELLSLDTLEIEPEAVDRLPEALVRRYEALPIRVLDDDSLLLAVTDPTNLRAADDLRLALGTGYHVAVIDRDAFEAAVARVFARRIELVVSDPEPRAAGETVAADIRDASATPTINLVNSILTRAVDLGASDIHVEPYADRLVVRARVDGVMRELVEVPKHMQASVTSRLKVMARLDIAERRLPQDGRVSVRLGNDPFDLRIAVVPTTHGEQIVLRLLHRASRQPTLADLGMSESNERVFTGAVRQPYGGIVVCGPTGSGKTTTLYAALDLLNDPGRVLMSIEDPVEYDIPGVNQIEVEVRAGLTFARGLRTILRSDPDVLLVGEIRDEETASIAIQAAMTGHIVLTSLHAHNAASAIARLRDMDVEPGLIANALNCIVAQRLVRLLCTECREPYQVPAAGILPEAPDRPDEVTFHRAVGCTRCDQTGYAGRTALHEVMQVRGEVRDMIERSEEDVFAAAARRGMVTLGDEGIRACVEGITSLDEIRRVLGDRLL